MVEAGESSYSPCLKTRKLLKTLKYQNLKNRPKRYPWARVGHTKTGVSKARQRNRAPTEGTQATMAKLGAAFRKSKKRAKTA
jgi:hypothetical protein